MKKEADPITKMQEAVSLNHPALKLYVIAFVLLVIAIVFGFISVFIPWAMKDVAPGQRAWAFPFKTCVEDTMSPNNFETCFDNDFLEPTGAPITQGNPTCEGFITTTIGFVFIYVLLGIVVAIPLPFLWVRLWLKPMLLAWCIQVGLVIVWIASLLAWMFFIAYAITLCQPDSIFPVNGYSYGFVITVFASGCTSAAMALGFWGIYKIKYYQPVWALEDPMEALYPMEAVYPVLLESPGAAYIPTPSGLYLNPTPLV